MDRDTVIALAREAGLWDFFAKYTHVVAGKNAQPENLVWSDLERFAALVAAHEREECAKVCDKRSDDDKWDGHYAHQCAAAIRSKT